jgi:hypothetical protein
VGRDFQGTGEAISSLRPYYMGVINLRTSFKENDGPLLWRLSLILHRLISLDKRVVYGNRRGFLYTKCKKLETMSG